jgi:hypothetical protein
MGSCLLDPPEGCKYVPTANGSQAKLVSTAQLNASFRSDAHPTGDDSTRAHPMKIASPFRHPSALMISRPLERRILR